MFALRVEIGGNKTMRMTEEEYQALREKIEREWPIKLNLCKQLGIKKHELEREGYSIQELEAMIAEKAK